MTAGLFRIHGNSALAERRYNQRRLLKPLLVVLQVRTVKALSDDVHQWQEHRDYERKQKVTE